MTANETQPPPKHPDFVALRDIVRGFDAALDRSDFDSSMLERMIDEFVDSESLTYMAIQRASKLVGASNGFDPRKGPVPLHVFKTRRNREMLVALASIYYEAFIVGIRFAERGQQS